MTDLHERHIPSTPAPEASPLDGPISTEYLRSMLNASEAQAEPSPSEDQDTREISPFGGALVSTAERIGYFLQKRAYAKSHADALKEYRATNPNDYIDHLSKLTNPNPDSPTDDPSNVAQQEFGQRQLEREEFRADVTEKIESGKKVVKKTGRFALRHLKKAGVNILGLGTKGKEAVVSGVKNQATTVKTAISTKVSDAVARKEAANQARLDQQQEDEKLFNEEFEKEKQRLLQEAAAQAEKLKLERQEHIKEAARRAAEAQVRKEARRGHTAGTMLVSYESVKNKARTIRSTKLGSFASRIRNSLR